MPTADNFAGLTSGLESPADRHYLIEPDDDVDLPFIPRTIVPLTNGTVQMVDKRGVAITYPVIAGVPLPFRPVRVMSTGTTATLAGWE